jgi:hypothetical protein
MFRSIDRWLWPYLKGVIRRPRLGRVTDLIFCFVDHFEPFRGGVSPAEALARVELWRDGYAAAAGDARDADGRTLPHTFFYPAEEYDAACLDCLADLCRTGAGEVEVHLHHRNDTAANLRRTLTQFTEVLHGRHGLLGVDRLGRTRYGFIHGNWALGNSRPDGDWCGVNDELSVLAETGCYADFTFPSAPSPTQPPMVNAIYRARDTGRPRPADAGERVGVWECGVWECGRRSPNADLRIGKGGGETGEVSHEGHEEREGPESGSGTQETRLAPEGTEAAKDRGLMLITGPLAMDWRRRKWGILPRIENGEVSAANPASLWRVRLWEGQGIGVLGRREWVFVKVHTHGCVGETSKMLLSNGLRALTAAVAQAAWQGGYRHHWVTAREMFNLVAAAEDGVTGAAGEHRDYLVRLT